MRISYFVVANHICGLVMFDMEEAQVYLSDKGRVFGKYDRKHVDAGVKVVL